MRRRTIWKGFLTALLACVLVSCSSLRSPNSNEQIVPTEKKAFQRLSLPPDAVVFDVLLTRVPYQDRELLRALWQDVDEQEVDATIKRRLNEQGFRVGVIGASLPPSLSNALSLNGRELRTSLEEEVDFSKIESTNSPLTRSKPVTLRAGAKSVVEMQEEVVPSIPILEMIDGSLVGKSYTDARPMLSFSIEPESDGSVRFDVSPFLRYGVPQPVMRYQHGQLVRAQEQPTKAFDRLKFSVNLRPGQFLVLGGSESESNILGRYFFGDCSVDFDQKLLVVRLLVTQHDGQFDSFPDFNELISRELDDEKESTDDETLVDLSGDQNESKGFEGYESSVVSSDDLGIESNKSDDAPTNENDLPAKDVDEPIIEARREPNGLEDSVTF